MTRKDFEAIAGAMLHAKVSLPSDATGPEAIAHTSAIMARTLLGTNPRFNVTRFLEACGIESTER